MYVKNFCRFCRILLNICKNRTVFLTLLLALLFIYLFLDNQFFQRHSGQPSIISHGLHPIIYTYLSQTRPVEKYLIDTPGCKIESELIIPEYYKKVWRVEKLPDCDYETNLARLDEEGQVLKLNDQFQESGCCFHEIERESPSSDNGYRLGDCELIQKEVNVTGKELFLTKCSNALNYEANFPLTPPVQEKLNYWKRRRSADDAGAEVYNVALIGIDTTSRSQAKRSLPKTLVLLEQMGFIDFKGYFAAPGFTEGYFMNFLLGKTFEESRQCKPNWTTPWDSCPFIWNEFNANQYVTMYIEDGHQTFNWGNQSGFQKKPTDYYAHQLFTAMEDMRQTYSGVWNVGNKLNMYAYCASQETVPQFVLRYLQRYIHKFSEGPAPFFTFTWFANPFHDFDFSLGNMDEHFYQFFRSIQAKPEILDKTLFVLMADHGNRISPFQETHEGPQERYLPPFFIRLPTKFSTANPEYLEAIRWNSVHLTTPLDAHHTVLHFLHLANLSITQEPFSPVQRDRSSLLLPVDEGRSCDYMSEKVNHCVCSKVTARESITNNLVLSELLEFATQELNLIVTKSEYANFCVQWTTSASRSIISARIIEKESALSQIVQFQFIADQGSAKFEVKIKIRQGTTTTARKREYARLSAFFRISLYRDQSHCVRFETTIDKQMKELCYCK